MKGIRPKVPERKAGGQRGNRNNLQHGFYAKLFTSQETAGMSDAISLTDEQLLLRTRVMRLARKIEMNEDLAQDLHSIETLLKMIHTIACLERTKAVVRGDGSGVLGDAIMGVLEKLDPYKDL